MNKHSLLTMLLCAGMLLALPGLSHAAKGEPEFTIRLSHASATTTFNHDIVEKWKSLVEANSDGRIFVEIYPNAQLMSVDQELPSVLEGRIEACYPHGYIGENVTPLYQIWGMPLLFGVGPESMESIYKLTQSDVYKKYVDSAWEKKGFKAWLGFADADHGIFTSTKKVKELKDLKGLKIRTGGGTCAALVGKAWDFQTITISTPELSTALMQNTVGGAEGGKIYFDKSAFPKLKYFFECASDYIGCGNSIVLSLEFYNSLPDDLKQAVDKAGEAVTVWTLEECAKRDRESVENLKGKGVEVFRPSDEVLKEMYQAWVPYMEQLTAKNQELKIVVDYILENYCPYAR